MKSATAIQSPSWAAAVASCCLALIGPAHAQIAIGESICGSPPPPSPGAFGPVDYRKATPQERSLVETYHFTPGIENMTTPKTTSLNDMAGDVAYTLNVLPNHPRALRTMWRLSNRDGKNPANAGQHTVECWFDRAIRFARDDAIPRLLFVQYLIEKGHKSEGLVIADSVLPLAADNPFTHYNLGLTYFDLGAFDKAAEQALKARELGMPREDLINKLKQAGRWQEPVATDAAKPSEAN